MPSKGFTGFTFCCGRCGRRLPYGWSEAVSWFPAMVREKGGANLHSKCPPCHPYPIYIACPKCGYWEAKDYFFLPVRATLHPSHREGCGQYRMNRLERGWWP